MTLIQLEDRCRQEKNRDWIKAACYWHMKAFAKTYLSHYVPVKFARHHEELFHAIPHGARGQKVNVLAPRGSAKSTLMAIIYPMWRICYTEADDLLAELGHKREHFIIICSKSYEMAESRVKAIQFEIETNDLIKQDFGDLQSSKWGIKSLTTSNSVRVRPVGRGGQIRGSLEKHNRPTLIISDDLDDPEKMMNPEQRKKETDWFNTDFLRAGNLDGSTNFLNIDTVKHEEATASVLRNRPGG